MSGRRSIAPLSAEQIEAATAAAPNAAAPTRPPEAPTTPATASMAGIDAGVRAAPSVAVRELLDYPIRLIPDLPLPTTLLLRRRHNSDSNPPSFVVITTSWEAYADARENKLPIFVGSELGLLALAAEHDRVGAALFEKWCAEKANDPNWKLTGAVAIGQITETLERRNWTCGQVFAAIDVELVGVTTEGQVPL